MGTATAQDNISRLLFGEIRREVLFLLMSRPDERFYVRQIMRAAGGGSGAVQRELKQLTEAGLIVREALGNQVFFSANRESPIFPELQSIIQKTAGTADVLRVALGGLAPKVRVAFVYGSVASGAAGARSDVDFLIIGDAALADVVSAIRPAQDRLAREVSVSLYSRREFRDKLRKGFSFLKRVMSGPKLFVIGDERELARLAR